ncbi:MAG: alanine-tRNA synthetase second additional domain-containing protein [Patescibacteria group bacterium]
MIVGLDRAVYFAPRGKRRLMILGNIIAQRYLNPDDRLIGLIGEGGAGKSLLIRGMFPGLNLTNDDDGVNVRPLPLLTDYEDDHFRTHTYHLDAHFELAFVQPWRLVDAVRRAVEHGKRVVVEHFELLHPLIGMHAEILVGIGEDVVVVRPSIFGPDPHELAREVFASIGYRRMAHSAEDLTSIVLEGMGLARPEIHSDVKRGFLLEFQEKPQVDLAEVEAGVRSFIERDARIAYYDDEHIQIEDLVYPCSGPRIHVGHAGEIKGFHLLPEFRLSPLTRRYLLAGLVGTSGEPDHEVLDPGEG